ncbi:MAG: hypothetical protein IKK26_01415 [Clostridia bacterium]|nr:hypothetical protein [Clostridia bacterium]
MIYIAFEKCENTPASQHEAGVSARNKLFSQFGINDIVKKNENGKPYIDNSDYHFSVSHSGNMAVCALRCKEEKYDLPDEIFTIFEDSEGEIGIDIQDFPSVNDLEKLNRISVRYFDKTFDEADDFIYHWTKTEAYCKYIGSALADVFKAETSDKSFFCGTIEFHNVKYIMSVCY